MPSDLQFFLSHFLSPVMVAVRDVVTPLALWASQEKKEVLFRPGKSHERGTQIREGMRDPGFETGMGTQG